MERNDKLLFPFMFVVLSLTSVILIVLAFWRGKNVYQGMSHYIKEKRHYIKLHIAYSWIVEDIKQNLYH